MSEQVVLVNADRRESRGRRQMLTDEQINQLITDYNNGMSQRQVATKYHVSLSTAQRYIRLRRA